MAASTARRSVVRLLSALSLLGLLLLSLSSPAWAQNRYGQAVLTSATVGSPTSYYPYSNQPSFRSNPECAMNLVQTNPTLFALGGYPDNGTLASATIPLGTFAQADLWLSTNGFASATYRAPVVVANLTTLEVGRLSGAAGYLANGNLVWTGGLISFAPSATGVNTYTYSASTFCSTDMGVSWFRSLTSNATYTPPTTRYEMSYAVMPYTNIMVIGGGYMPFVSGEGGADVWMSSDGTGSVWTLRNAGGSVPVNYGGAMVGLYDNSAVSSSNSQAFSTLVWVMTVGSYYLSTDGGVTWGTAYQAPWAASFLPYPTFSRELPVLTADHDNYLYYGGGDLGGPAPDFWLSIDKAQTWTQLQIQSSAFLGGSAVYAASWGSCLAVRVLTGGAKELDLYGGTIWTYGRNAAGALVYNNTAVYAMQMALSFASTPYPPQVSQVAIPQTPPMRWYFNYLITSTAPAYTICASGYVFTPTNPTIPTYTSTLASTSVNATYLVWWIQGTRVYSNATATISQTIAGLGPLGDDGASQYIYPNAAVQVDNGGLTYLLAGTGLGETQNFVNVYSTGTGIAEDYPGVGTRTITSPIRFSRTPLAPPAGCQVFVQASLNSGLQGAAPSPTSHTSTPQFRANPECAYQLTSTNTLNPTYIALGGFNTSGAGADIPYPSYAQGDLWISTDGFSSTANTRYQASVYNLSNPITKLSGVAGLLTNGILVYSGGLAGEYNGYIYFSTTTWASADMGATWNISLNTVIDPVLPYASTMRFDPAYCVVPYTNTIVMAGGIGWNSYPNAAADVWISSDGLGRNWTLQNNGNNPRSTVVHAGGVMVALYDSTLVSAQYVTPNSTLVLILDSAANYKSGDLGRTWSMQYTAPWAPANVPYATYTRSLPVLTADRDNYLYYGGGDSGTPQADWWFSWDKAESWTPIALGNGLSGYQFAAAIGSCLGVRYTAYSPISKELDLYGGSIFTRQVNSTTNAVVYSSTPYYSMQMQLAFSTTQYTAPLSAVPTPSPITWYWAYQVSSSAGFTVCASGTVITPATPTVETLAAGVTANYAYLVWYLTGTRVFTNSTLAYSEVIGGLGPIWEDGATQLIYPNQAIPVDGGGLTYQLSSVQPGDTNAYINLYNGGSSVVEDGFQGTVTNLSRPLTFSRTPLTGANSVCSSIIRGQATISAGLVGSPISFTGQNNLPQYRSDPECAYDLNSTNPTMWAMGGYNQTSGTWSLAYPSFGKGDTWLSTDGFSSAANTVYVPGAQTYPRIAGCAAYLANGNLLTWAGVTGEYSGYIYFAISVGVSYDRGNTYNYSIYNDPAYSTNPSISRYEAAYCALPYTNTVVHVGGVNYATYPNPSSDVWMSSDGLGAVWTQQNAGGSATNVRPFQGGVMAAFYDSSYVSPAYISPNSTLLLIAPTANYYKSFDLGRTWTFQYTPPWFRGQSNYVTIVRYLPVLTIDKDNYAYYGGGDAQTVAPDFWLSVDKAETWSRLQMVNTLQGNVYAASVGSCMAVRLVNGQKQLSLYGGNIYTRVYNTTTASWSYSNTALYSLQMQLQFNSSAFQNIPYQLPQAMPVTYYWSYQLRQSNVSMPQFSVCAYGQIQAASTPTFANSAAYPVWSMTGARIFTNATYSFSQAIGGLAYLNTDGSTNRLYPNSAIPVDGGGITYVLGSTGLGEAYTFVNVYSNGVNIVEAGWLQYETQAITTGMTVSRVPFNQYNPPCRINAQASVVSSLTGAAAAITGQTSTPQFRSNPECAYDLNSTNPVMLAIGGYNVTGGSAAIPYPVYAQPDIWVSADGFTSSANSQWVPGQVGYPRLASCAALLNSGALLTWCGLIGEYSGYIYFESSVTISLDQGRTWNTTYSEPNPVANPSVVRMEAAYCGVPYTNTVVHAGGVNYQTYPNPSSDVWISTDGRGAVWTLQSNGALPAFRGGAIVALYDSSFASSTFLTPNATLVLVPQQPIYALSTDLGATWTTYQAPWAAAISSSPVLYRTLPVLTADHDSYIYYAGGDTQMWAPDMWLSVDKGYSWSRIAVSTQLSAQQYAGAIGSCMAVRVVGGQKQLSLYGGNILTWSQSTGLFTSTPIYAIQLNLAFVNRTSYNLTTTLYPVSAANSGNVRTLYWQYAYTESVRGGFSVCASGTMQVSSQTTYLSTGTANPAYLVLSMQGTRITTNMSTNAVTSQIITGLAPIGVGLATQLYYPLKSPPLDTGGVTYYLASTGLGEAYSYVNLYAATGATVFTEAYTYGTLNFSTPGSSPLVISATKGTLSCPVYSSATIASGLAGTAPSFYGQTSTPQYRSNPECAYDLTATNTSSPRMFAIGGYNVTGGGAVVPYPAYAQPDIWVSTDGFTSTANTQWVRGQVGYARLSSCAAFTASGALINWCGLSGEYSGYVWFETAVTYSMDLGYSWNTSYTDPSPSTRASVTRYEAAYCVLPFTNTLVHAGGISYISYPSPSSDVWISTDGTGAVWQQMNTGGSATTVPPFSGGQMVGMYDSSVISAQFPSPNATLVLVLDTAQYFKSTDLGFSWTTAYAAPWDTSFTPYPTYTRSLPVLAADQDNYLYFAGGDAGGAAPDMWVSVDKAETWSRMSTLNSFSSTQQYAASVGSCMAVRVVNGVKQLDLYGGNIWTYSSTSSSYTSSSVYSLQINVQFTPTAPTTVASTVPAVTGQLWYWQYKLASNSTTPFTICATGRLVTSSQPTLPTITSTNPAYLVWWMSGNRVYTSATTSQSQAIAGLAALDVDGASQYLYPSQTPPVDGGGLTYLLAGQGLGESNAYVNLYNTGGSFTEDSVAGTVTVTMPITLSKTPFASGCPFYATGTLSAGLALTGGGYSGATTPVTTRYNPECAFDPSSTNPTLFALGGSADGGVTTQPDLWSSTDGFSTAANTIYTNASAAGRMNGGAAYLANGNLVWFGGLVNDITAATYLTNVYVSATRGATWNTSSLGASTLRQSFAYCAVPYTNTIVMAGGILYSTGSFSNDVWISSDGAGAVWTQQTNGSGTTVAPHVGAAMVALFDSNLVLSVYPATQSTLVLVDHNLVYQSYNLGVTWTNATTASWPLSYGGTRRFPVLAADRDNFLYFAGGDNVSPDVWFSADKGYSWTQLGTSSYSLSTGNYAAALGACSAVRVVNGVKTLTIYGGNIFSYAGGAYTQNYYALQVPLAYQGTAPSYATSPIPPATSQTAYYKYTLGGAGYSVCAAGTITLGSAPLLGVLPVAYNMYAITGSRIFTNASSSITQAITGLAPIGTDGASNRLYIANPHCDGGGITFYVSSPLLVLGGVASVSYVNLFNNSGSVTEDYWATAPAQSGAGFVWSFTNDGSFTCANTPTAVSSAAPRPSTAAATSPAVTVTSAPASPTAAAPTSAPVVNPTTAPSATSARAATSAAVVSPTSGAAVPPGGGSSSSSGLSGGAIAGIVVGSVVAAVLCLLFLVFCLFTRRKGKGEMSTTMGGRDSEVSTVRPSQMEMAPVEHSRVDAERVGDGHGEEAEETA